MSNSQFCPALHAQLMPNAAAKSTRQRCGTAAFINNSCVISVARFLLLLLPAVKRLVRRRLSSDLLGIHTLVNVLGWRREKLSAVTVAAVKELRANKVGAGSRECRLLGAPPYGDQNNGSIAVTRRREEDTPVGYLDGDDRCSQVRSHRSFLWFCAAI